MTGPEERAATAAAGRARRSTVAAFTAGSVVGVLGGMIGLGGAECRQPLLIGLFGFVALQAVVVNKAMSAAVVLTALPARLVAVPYGALAPHRPVAVEPSGARLPIAERVRAHADRTRTTVCGRG